MTYILNVKAFTDSISDRDLQQLCRENPDLRFEIDSNGKLRPRVRRRTMVNLPVD